MTRHCETCGAELTPRKGGGRAPRFCPGSRCRMAAHRARAGQRQAEAVQAQLATEMSAVLATHQEEHVNFSAETKARLDETMARVTNLERRGRPEGYSERYSPTVRLAMLKGRLKVTLAARAKPLARSCELDA